MSRSKNWILLRGLARGVGHWGSFVERLKARHPEDQFECLDLPGNGARHLETSPLKIADYVKDLRAHSLFVKRGEKFNILSISLGSMITVEWMREFPHEVQKAFLICTSSSGFSPFYERFRLINYVKAAQLMASRHDEVKYEKTVLEMVTNSQERRDEELLAMAEYTKAHPLKPSNVLRQILAASQYQFPKEAPGSVVILGSHGDHLVSPDCTLAIAQKWGQQAHMHPWAGHDIPVDDPSWVMEHLL